MVRIQLQTTGKANLPMRFTAGVIAAVFVFATHSCVCEAFSSGSHTHADAAAHQAVHQHEASGRHNQHAPEPVTRHDPCCATLRAIAMPSVFKLFAGLGQSFPHNTVLEAVDAGPDAYLFLAPNGLSPPASEPIPTQPFYCSTFASHAPPVCLV